MSSHSPLVRALLFLLALVPVVWGTCPRWVAGEACGGPARGATHGETARCPCCPPCEDAPPDAPRDRRSPTDPASCPVIQLRYTVAPAPADVAMPVTDVVAVATVFDVPQGPSAPRCELLPRDTSGGAPPPRVGTVVLRI